MAIALNNYFELVVYTRCADQAALNVLHYQLTALSGPQPTEQQAVDAITAWLKTPVASMMAPQASYRGCSLRVWFGAAFGGYYYSKNASSGTRAGTVMPKQASGIISWRTAVGGRRGRGRSYIAFPDEDSNIDTGYPDATYMADIETLAAKMQNTGALIFSGANTMTANLVIWHRPFSAPTLVDHHTTPQKWATQRRRGDFGRPNKVPDALA